MGNQIKMLSNLKSSLGIAAAGAGVCFIGYCIYFDRKRRSDPQFRRKLRERRRQEKLNQKNKKSSAVPDLKDPEAMQKFFMQEIQLGEELLAQGEIEEGVEHLSNAVAICGQRQQLLQVLQQTLPPQVFQLLVQNMPIAAARMAGSASLSSMTEDDLE